MPVAHQHQVIYNSPVKSGTVQTQNGEYTLKEFTINSAIGTGYIYFDHDYLGDGETLGLYIWDPTGSNVYSYNGGWGGPPSPPVIGSFFAWIPGTYKVQIKSESYTVNWRYGSWLKYNLNVMYPSP